jgi:zinc protease
MKTNRIIALVMAATLLAPGLALAQKKRTANRGAKSLAEAYVPSIKFTQFFLPNGLRVIFHEDHSTPIVGVNLWYHVGSKNESPGRTGFAHLFEHMMFQGFKGYDYDYVPVIQEVGGAINGSTTPDRTNYWELLPSNFLETAIFMEAGRMKGLLEAMTQKKLDNQRDVVKNEKRQRIDNQPYGQSLYKISAAMYPPEHPYHWSTIGSMEDLTAASLEDVKGFFRTYYVPNNASLVISGDFNPAEARAWVQKYFGPIPKGAAIKRPNPAAPALTREIRDQFEDRVQLPRVYMVWHSVPQYTKDEAALDLLSSILGAGKSSRLFKALIYDKQIAQQSSSFNQTGEIAGTFNIVATAKPGRTLAELEQVIDEEIAKLKAAPPTAEEMERVKNAREASFIFGLQNVGGFGGKDDQLNGYATFLKNPGYVAQDLARYRAVTAADVQRVANQYLTNKRYVLSVVPRAAGPVKASFVTPAQTQQPGTGEAGQQPTGKAKTADPSLLPKEKPDPKLTLPAVQRRKLSNGLEVLVVEHHELPVVSMNLVMKTGGAGDPQSKAGLASLTADMLDEGTTTRSALEISDQLSSIGTGMQISAGWDSTTASVRTLTRHIDRALEIYADVILNPAFPENELQRLRTTRLAALRQQRDNPDAIAGLVFQTALYGRNHPYGHPLNGDEDSLKSLSKDDVRNFYETFLRPNNSALIIVGNVKPDVMVAKLEKAFGNWKRGDVPTVDVSAAPIQRDRSVIYLVDRPGSVQSVINIGQVGVPRSSPDYFPLLVMNRILGGASSARINLNLREDKGYTYGANSIFSWRRGAGPFVAQAPVQGFSTKESVIEFMKELRGIRGEIPVSTDELETAKRAMVRAFPRSFETPDQIANGLETIVNYDLPDSYFNTYAQRIKSVTLADLNRVANRYLQPDRMVIVVVGDRSKIEESLRSLPEIGANITFLDKEGRPANAGH